MTPTIVNLLGKRFGKLVVAELVGTKKSGNKRTTWKCKCDCGNTVNVNSENLRRGKQIGCGKCRYKIANQYGSYNLREYDTAFNVFYNSNLKRTCARERNLEFKLTKSEVREITAKNCFYCGSPPSNVMRARNKFGSDFIYNGIDRVDNNKGYVIENVVACCKKCNQAKMNLTADEFKQLVIAIYQNWASK